MADIGFGYRTWLGLASIEEYQISRAGRKIMGRKLPGRPLAQWKSARIDADARV